MTIQAPAKVNLVLRILAKRPDGYHDIETLMVPVSLSDEIDVEVSTGTGIQIVCDDPDIPVDCSNLIWQATDVFARHTGLTFQTRVVLKKHIPHGAGLGGGSSDAAALLKSLDNLHGTNLGVQQLERLASVIGSDVPFFIRGRPAFCRGRGELMEEPGEIPSAHLLLVKPPFPVSTREAYQAFSARGAREAARPEAQYLGGIELLNDLEAPVFKKFLLLPVIKAWLLKQEEVTSAMMSGSGSTLFAVLRNGAGTLGHRAKARFGQHLWTSEVVLNPPAAEL